MRKFFPIIFTFSMLVVLAGCQKYLDYEGNDAVPRLVINGVFQPDSVFEVELSQSAGYLTTGSLKTISDGSVEIFADGIRVDSLSHIGNGRYRGSVLPASGIRYTVSAAGGKLENAQASDWAPPTTSPASLNWTILETGTGDLSTSKLRVDFSINDPADESNYYTIECYGLRTYYINYDPYSGSEMGDTVFIDPPVYQRITMETSDAILSSTAEFEFDDNIYYAQSIPFTDELFNGKSQSFRFAIPYIYEWGVTEITFILKSTSEAFYRYERTINNFYETDGDPFSQPVQVYTNIEGGLGIWAGYSISKTKIEL